MRNWDIKKLIGKAEYAIEDEINIVREHPSTDILIDGKRVKTFGEDNYYRFETSNSSLRYTEECTASFPDKEICVYPAEIEKESIIFRIPADKGETIPEMPIEWENDFVLRKIQETLAEVSSGSDKAERIKRMICPEASSDDGGDMFEDGLRNDAQMTSIRKAMTQPVSYIWGPPGTGKTATLSYIIANFLSRGKSVLFTCNTNRAVDHGMLGVMEALDVVGLKAVSRRVTRFGEVILEDKRLDKIHFDKQLDELLRSRMERASELQQWLEMVQRSELSATQQRMALDKIESLGGVEAVEEQIHELTQREKDAFVQIRRFKLVGTTLARVCTSDLLNQMEFDAVVVDEASMASIPYMLVMAARAKEHLVVVGDPMQLPPISQAKEPEARAFLEQDLFGLVSKASSAVDLFKWHDDNPAYTSFFDVQYRMQSDLARVISDVFYEGRLVSASDMVGKTDQDSEWIDPKTGEILSQMPENKHDAGSVSVVDSSPLKPALRQASNRKGFQPVNDVHVSILHDLIRDELIKNRTALSDIGIIVPFRSTVWHLRKELIRKHHWYELEIGTIHTFQGREKNVIILDTVMTGEPRGKMVSHYSVRPFDESKNGLSVPRLLNVAFSRSRERLTILADMDHIQRVYAGKFLGKLLNRLPVKRL